MTTPAPAPNEGWMPPPPQEKPSFFARRWVQVSGAGLIGLVIGAAAGGGGSAATDTVGKDEVTAAIERAEEAEAKLADAQAQLAAAGEEADAPDEPAEPAPAEPAADGGDLSDGSFTSEPPQLKDDGLGDFGGTARVTNTSDSEKSALLTYTFFKDGEQVGTAQGSASEVGAGETATVQLVSTDPFVAGVDRVEFQVDGEF